MSGIALGTIIVGAGAAAWQAYDAKDSGAGADRGMRVNKKLDFGSVPDAAMYNPVDFNAEQLQAILSNMQARPFAQELGTDVNRWITADALKRAKKLIPGYKESMRAYGGATGDLLRGQLPYDDVLGIVSDRAELAGALGVPGTAGNATLKDLGISRLGAIEKGGGMLKDMVSIAETISPRSSYFNPASMFVNPQNRIQNSMEQSALIQQSEQNRFNLEASGDPGDMARAGIGLAQGSGVQAPGADWANIAASLIGSAASMYGGAGSGGTSGYYGARPNYANWQTGPQPGTYYVPRTAV